MGGGGGERHTGKNERQKEKRERERQNKIRKREGGREGEREKNMLGTYYATKWTRLCME